jgi:2-keto-4-pentenoate hydratase/2-oxohepta-3-ene-1,7-dioic acid hydratase in catechol pathway
MLLLAAVFFSQGLCAETTRYVRFEQAGQIRYGILDGETVRELSAGLFPPSTPTGRSFQRDAVRLLPPTEARKVFAVGMNFSSHLASSAEEPPPLFLKLPTSLIGDREVVVLPADARNVHFEGELVLVIGRHAKDVSLADAPGYIFGVTNGNDLTERSWQGRDLQWMRAKASDGFGPVGPAVVTGLDYNNLLLTTRLNGEIVQHENTRNMIHKPAKVVSYLSRYFTLEPGDLVFMGTPGQTRPLVSGDLVEVQIDGLGTLSNRIR